MLPVAVRILPYYPWGKIFNIFTLVTGQGCVLLLSGQIWNMKIDQSLSHIRQVLPLLMDWSILDGADGGRLT